MVLLTYDHYASLLIDWCEERADFFRYLYPLKGGWEAWVQADYAAFVFEQVNDVVDIYREVPIFNNAQQRVDWLFNNEYPIADKIAIEIKCQTFLTRDNFINGLETDIYKLRQPNISAPYFRGCQTGVLGICFDGVAYQYMLDNGFTEIYHNAQGEISCCIKKLFPVV